MIQVQKFVVIPDGVIKGGEADYSFDSDAGTILYNCEIDLPFWRSKKYSGTYHINPDTLRSEKFWKLGNTVLIGPATFTVNLAKPSSALVSLSIVDKEVTGTIRLDTSQEFAKIVQVSGVGQMVGISYNIILVPIGA